jgi:diguanylate cyclase (GGDEF)-like protein
MAADVTVADDSEFYRELLRAYLDSANDAIFVLCDEMKFLVCNRTMSEWLGESEADLTAHIVREPITRFLVDPEHLRTFTRHFHAAIEGQPGFFECQIHPVNAPPRWVEISINRVNLGTGIMLIAVARDIGKRRARIATMEYQASHEALTGLPNRSRLLSRMRRMLESEEDRALPFALLIIDLDRFRDINSALGHETGDRVIKAMGVHLGALQLQSPPRLIAHLGSDEFALLLRPADLDAAADCARAVMSAMEAPLPLGPDTPFDPIMGVSIGIAVYPRHGVTVDSLIRHADVALEEAKTLHSGFAFYDVGRDRHTPDRLIQAGELRRAIDSDQLELHYQPIIDLTTGDLTGAEALVRWRHEIHGLIPPDNFIPLAEQTGLIRPLDRWVMKTAVAQCKAWHGDGLQLSVSVNLSVDSLHDPRFAGWVGQLLADCAMQPQLIQIEVTESAMMTDPDLALEVLSTLSRQGMIIALDDFGTGYSSLSYLKRLPLHKIKIDRAFVMGMTADDNDAVIVRSTIDLAHNLAFDVVAEGVETAESLALLKRLGCDAAQGYHISRPLPADKFLDWAKHYIPPGR